MNTNLYFRKSHRSLFNLPLRLILLCLITLPGILLSSCGEDKFKIKGTIEGEKSADRSIILEKSDFGGRWIAVDSTRTNSKGNFTLSRVAPAYPEVFRIGLDGEYIYLPVDSVETLEVTAKATDFAKSFKLTGTLQAEAMGKFEKELIALPGDGESLKEFKRKIFTEYMAPWQGRLISYYVLTKVRDGKPLFDPSSTEDIKYFAAVANGFRYAHPDDPRTAMLEKTATDGMRQRNTDRGIRRVIEADETQVIDITLPNENGEEISLSSMVGGGVPTILIFSLMNHPDSPALNRELNQIYTSKGGNIRFYHVSLDDDQFAWREGAKNLPWTTVYDADGSGSRSLVVYNVSTLPTFFIYNAQGNLTSRADNLEDLRSKL